MKLATVPEVQSCLQQLHPDPHAAPALAGQSAGLIHEVKTAQQIIEETVSQFHAITARMGAMAALQHFG